MTTNVFHLSSTAIHFVNYYVYAVTYIFLFERHGCLPSLLTDGVTSAQIANKCKPQTSVILGHISCAGWKDDTTLYAAVVAKREMGL